MCACTESDGTGVGAVYVECGVQTSMLTVANKHAEEVVKHHPTWISTRNASRYEEPFFSVEKSMKKRLALRARAAHYDTRTTAAAV